MKLSQFTVVIKDYPKVNRHLLYHTLTRALIEVDKEGWDVLHNLSTGFPTDEKSQAYIKAIQRQGFLVPKGLNEGERYLEYLGQHKTRKGGTLSITLLTNLQRCPLACTYCYQKGTHTGERLEGDLSEKCLTFIENQCDKLEAERLFISYYGSEPLSNLKAILSTTTELKQFCEKKGIRFHFGMVTNGVLLTRKVVEKLLPLGFVHTQITIDGNQQTHDSSRPFQNGKGSYGIIMKNLESYAGLIRTDVLCVLDESRVKAAYELIDHLSEKGYANKRVRVLISPVSETYDTQRISAAQSSIEGDRAEMARRSMPVEIARLKIYAVEKGLVDDLYPGHTWCAMQRHDERHLTLTPDGKLYTCSMFIGRDAKYEAGHIKTGIGGIDTVLKAQYRRSQTCLTCRYLPICADCRADALLKTGDVAAAEELDLIVPELIKGQYRLTQHRSSVTD